MLGEPSTDALSPTMSGGKRRCTELINQIMPTQPLQTSDVSPTYARVRRGSTKVLARSAIPSFIAPLMSPLSRRGSRSDKRASPCTSVSLLSPTRVPRSENNSVVLMRLASVAESVITSATATLPGDNITAAMPLSLVSGDTQIYHDVVHAFAPPALDVSESQPTVSSSVPPSDPFDTIVPALMEDTVYTLKMPTG